MPEGGRGEVRGGSSWPKNLRVNILKPLVFLRKFELLKRRSRAYLGKAWKVDKGPYYPVESRLERSIKSERS